MSIELPNRLHFVCVGPQRTATSWLHQRLRSHPQVSLPTLVKETFFFDEHYNRGLSEYWRLFSKADISTTQVGEIAPTYFDSEHARGRLRQFENLKVIINVRDPIERTYSLFRHHRTKGRVPKDYFAAISQMPRIETSGQYAVHCPRWEGDFGIENVYYVLQRDIERSAELAVNSLCRFLELREISLSEEEGKRYGQSTRPPIVAIARIAAKVATYLRARSLHAPLEFAKKLGMRELVFGQPAGGEKLPDNVREHLEQYHAADLQFLRARFGEQYSECAS